MPTQAPSMMILPQYQGNYYDLQMQQALAQQLMANASQNQASLIPSNMPVMPKYSLGAGAAQLGQALLAAKIAHNVGQGYQDLGQQQMAYLAGTPAQTATAQSPQVDAGGVSAAQGGSGDGVQSFPVSGFGGSPAGSSAAGAPAAQPAAAPLQGGLLAPGSAMNPSGMDPTKAAVLLQQMGMEKYSEQYIAPYVKPTDTTLAARQAGYTPAQVQQANAGKIFKDNYVAPITGTGTFRDPRTMQPVAFNPDVPAGSTPLFDASGNVAAVQPIQGAQGVMQGNAAATAAGSAQFKPVQVYNPRTGQMEYSNEAAVTNPSQGGGGAPTLSGIFAQQESGGGKTAPDNPMQIQQGTFKQYAQPSESWTNPADRTNVANRVLNTYQQKYGGDLGRIATAYFSGEGNVAPAGSPTPFIKNVSDSNGKTVASYVGDILGRGAGMSQGGGSGAAAAPPLGQVANANTAQEASAQSMKSSYAKLQSINSNANAALDALQKMQALGANKNPVMTAGALGTTVAPTLSQDAAEYEKQRANVVSLLANQNGTNGSDAGRALTGESVPDYGKPKGAIQDGLQTQINQIRQQQLKASVLTPVYQSGDSKKYTTLENQFDQAVKPSTMPALLPVLQMSGAQQQAAVKAAIGANPSLKPSFEILFNAGMLK